MRNFRPAVDVHHEAFAFVKTEAAKKADFERRMCEEREKNIALLYDAAYKDVSNGVAASIDAAAETGNFFTEYRRWIAGHKQEDVPTAYFRAAVAVTAELKLLGYAGKVTTDQFANHTTPQTGILINIGWESPSSTSGNVEPC